MNFKSLFIGVVLFAFAANLPAQTQSKIFDDMMAWINNSEYYAGGNFRQYKMMWSNNTLRNSPEQPNGFQYISYAVGTVDRRISDPKITSLDFVNIPQSFVDSKGEVNRDRDRIDIKIYKSGSTVKVQEKLLSWGSGVTTHNATIERSVLGGYCIRYKSTNGTSTSSYYTILLNRDSYHLD